MNQIVIDLLTRIGKQRQATPTQMLVWLLVQHPWIAPVPGSCKVERLEENTAAVYVELTEGDPQEIDRAMSMITILRDRY